LGIHILDSGERNSHTPLVLTARLVLDSTPRRGKAQAAA
jgi:hypothetical protein